jgi:hypothetical protein
VRTNSPTENERNRSHTSIFFFLIVRYVGLFKIFDCHFSDASPAADRRKTTYLTIRLTLPQRAKYRARIIREKTAAHRCKILQSKRVSPSKVFVETVSSSCTRETPRAVHSTARAQALKRRCRHPRLPEKLGRHDLPLFDVKSTPLVRKS